MCPDDQDLFVVLIIGILLYQWGIDGVLEVAGSFLGL